MLIIIFEVYMHTSMTHTSHIQRVETLRGIDVLSLLINHPGPFFCIYIDIPLGNFPLPQRLMRCNLIWFSTHTAMLPAGN